MIAFISVNIYFSLAVSIYILFAYKRAIAHDSYSKYNVHDKICRVITFTPKQWTLEVNHSRTINDNNNAKPSGFIFYVEAILSEIFQFARFYL